MYILMLFTNNYFYLKILLQVMNISDNNCIWGNHFHLLCIYIFVTLLQFSLFFSLSKNLSIGKIFLKFSDHLTAVNIILNICF